MSAAKGAYGVLDLLWDIRDAHSICKDDATAKAILWAIASRSNSKKDFTCFPAEKRIAGDISVSVRTVQRHLKLLLDEDLIKMTRRYDDSYRYCVCVDKIRTAADQQRKIWAAEKAAQSAADEAFEQAVKANRAIATPSPVAEDATFLDTASKSLDYSEALAQAIVEHETLAERISEAEARSLAAAICMKHAGSAPVIALGYLGDDAITKAANGRTPIGYLRSLIEKKIAEFSNESYDPSGDVEEFIQAALTAKRDGKQYLFVATVGHPGGIDAGIEAIQHRLGITFKPPCLTRDDEGTYLLFEMPDGIPSGEDADQDNSANDESESVDQGFGEADGDSTAPKAKAATPTYEFEDDEKREPVEEVEPEPPANQFQYQRMAFADALKKETDLLKCPADRITISLDSQTDLTLGWVGTWLDSVSYDGKITRERVSRSVLRVTLTWDAARYIAEHAEQFAKDGWIDPDYQPAVDPAVLAEIEAEKQAAEELERELARKQREEAEAAEIQRKAEAEAAEAEAIQRKEDAVVAEAARKQKNREWNCRRLLIESMDEDGATFDYMGEKATVNILRDYLTTAFPNTLTLTYESDSLLQGKFAPSLLEALKQNPVGFRENGYVETDADRELAAAA